jgi:hypothetical protein
VPAPAPVIGPGPAPGFFPAVGPRPAPLPLLAPVPVPVPVFIPQPVPVPVIVPAPVFIFVPVFVPQPVPVFIPVVVPRRHVVFVPVVQHVVLPALGQVLAGESIPPVLPTFADEPILTAEPFQEVPLQFVPLEPDLYALVHPLLFCDLDVAETCEALAEQLAEIAPGFGTIIMDGPNGYGVYLTYQSSDLALDQILAAAPSQEHLLESDDYAVVQLLLFCAVDGAETCESLGEELAEIRPGFGTTIMDGPQGYGVYLTYQMSTY